MTQFDTTLSWVVCGAAFISHTLTVGFSYSISVYYVEFLHVFNESKGTTAWVSSLNYGVLCAIGPVASLLIHRWGHRVTMFLGGIIAAAGLLICAFANNLSVVLISFGFLTGLGSGLAYAAAVVVICVYFKKYRPLAYGLSLAGVGVGNMAFPWISSALISSLGWRGALIISSGLVLHICVAAMLVMPQIRTKKPLENLSNGNSYGSRKTAAQDTDHHKAQERKSIKEQNKELFTNVYFILLMVNMILFIFGVSIMFTHILAYFELEGVSPSVGRLILSLLGGANLTGRIGLSALSQLPCVNTICLYIGAICMCGMYIGAICMCGASTILLGVWTSTANLVTCSCVFGFFGASFGPTLTECGFLITGPELFNIAFGYLLINMGIGWLLGAPAAGMLFDATQHYPNSFYLGGGVMIAAAVVMVPVAMFLKKKDFPGNRPNPS